MLGLSTINSEINFSIIIRFVLFSWIFQVVLGGTCNIKKCKPTYTLKQKKTLCLISQGLQILIQTIIEIYTFSSSILI